MIATREGFIRLIGRAVAAAAAVAVVATGLGGGLPARAETTPVAPKSAPLVEQASPQERKKIRRELFRALKSAETEKVGRAVEDMIWQYWFVAPSPTAEGLLKDAMAARRDGELERAALLLDDLVALEPTYAEAWNQRAFTRFLMDDFDGSLADIKKTLELEPKHFGALAGRAHVFRKMGLGGKANRSLARAVSIHPWLKERELLAPTGREKSGDKPKKKGDPKIKL